MKYFGLRLLFALSLALLMAFPSAYAGGERNEIHRLGLVAKSEKKAGETHLTLTFDLSPAAGQLLFAYLVYSDCSGEQLKVPAYLPAYVSNNKFVYKAQFSADMSGDLQLELFHASPQSGENVYSTVGGLTEGKLQLAKDSRSPNN